MRVQSMIPRLRADVSKSQDRSRSILAATSFESCPRKPRHLADFVVRIGDGRTTKLSWRPDESLTSLPVTLEPRLRNTRPFGNSLRPSTLDSRGLMRHHQKLFEQVRQLTSMYLPDTTYYSAVAFVSGYDAACEGGVLEGFREWLVVRLGKGSNLGWPALVLHLAFPDAVSPQGEQSRSPENEHHAVETLFDLIGDYDKMRLARNGLQKVFAEYECWENRKEST